MAGMRIPLRFCFLLAIAGILPAQDADPPVVEAEPTIRDQIDTAIATADKDNKRVLITFASQDEASEELARRMKTSLRRQLLYEFVTVAADAVQDATVAKAHGLDLDATGTPSLLVLDADRKVIARVGRDTLWNEDKGVDSKAVAALLKKVHAPPLDGEQVLAAALAEAKATNRQLLLHFDAPW